MKYTDTEKEKGHLEKEIQIVRKKEMERKRMNDIHT